MSVSNVDKRVKNARLAVERATTPQQRARAEAALAAALRAKDEMKVTRR